MKQVRFLVLILIFLFLFITIFATDYLAADKTVAKYRTGIIDSVSKNVPRQLQEKVFENPEKYLGELVAFLIRGIDNDFLKIKRIHDWITNNIAYDTALFLGISDEGSRDAYKALKYKRTTCTGFSGIFKKMATLAGFEAVLIEGYTKTYFIKSKNRIGGHKWNGVKIKDKWYIVDCSHDSRMSHKSKDEENEKKKDYNDTNLFISPEAKILINFPKEEKYQFTEKRYSYEEFASFPQVKQYFKAYNVKFIGDMSKVINRKYEDREGGYLQSIKEYLNLKNKIGTIVIRVPNNVIVSCFLKDQDNNSYVYNSISYREGKDTICQFSAPAKGIYKAYIKAKYPKEENFHTIYKCYIDSKDNGPILPMEEGKLFTNSRMQINELKILKSDLTGKNGIYYLDISYPPDTELVSNLKDIDNKSYADEHIVTSYFKNGKRYYYSLPGKGTYFIKLYSKKKSDEGNRKYTGIVKISGSKINSPLPPANTLILRQRFFDNNFDLLKENVFSNNKKSVYTITIKAPTLFTMACNLRDENNNKLKGFCKTEKNGNIYTFTITNPHKGRCKVKIFQIDNKKRYRTIAYFFVE